MDSKYSDDNEAWGYACDIRKRYGPYTKYNIEELDEVFKNGKRKFKCVFSACDGFEYATHDAVICTNKKTKEEFYKVRIMSVNKCRLQNRQIDNDQQRIREELKAEADELNNQIEPLEF